MITKEEMEKKIAEAMYRQQVSDDGEYFLRVALKMTLDGVRTGEFRQGMYDAGMLIFNQFMGVKPPEEKKELEPE
jgi:hypothetical protein